MKEEPGGGGASLKQETAETGSREDELAASCELLTPTPIRSHLENVMLTVAPGNRAEQVNSQTPDPTPQRRRRRRRRQAGGGGEELLAAEAAEDLRQMESSHKTHSLRRNSSHRTFHRVPRFT